MSGAWSAANPEKNRESARRSMAKWRHENPEKAREATKRYCAAWYEKRRTKTPELLLLYAARARAKRGGYPCTITGDDIVIPPTCPVLGVEMKKGVGEASWTSPTLDKIDPSLGYVPGNVQVMSKRANLMKGSANRSELEAFARWVLGLRQLGEGSVTFDLNRGSQASAGRSARCAS